jgi:uncharacterized integral membrane protein
MNKILSWLFALLKLGLFFTLFAFALNNLEDVNLKFFFGKQWTGPMILVVLAVFSLGVMVGVLGMLPRWWAYRKWVTKNTPVPRPESGLSGAESPYVNAPSPDLSSPAIVGVNPTRAPPNGL